MKETQEKYATLIVSMSTDFLLGKITFEHYTDTLKTCVENMEELIDERTT